MKDIRNYNLVNNNTFGISEECRRFVEPTTVEELKEVLRTLTEADQPLLIIGGGSNLLLTKRYEGTVLRSAIKGIEQITACDGHAEGLPDDCQLVRCGSGTTFDDVVEYCVSNGLYGAENLSIIPGDVGASAVQNIGAYGVEAKDIIYRIEAVDVQTGEDVVIFPDECQYGYRQSRFKGEWKGRYVITYVTYRLSRTFTPHLDYGNIRAELERRDITKPTAQDVRDVIISIRNEKLPDPKVEGNAGSFFMNPIVERPVFEALQQQYPQMPHYFVDSEHEKVPAGWLIDQCGWKGVTCGSVGVHPKQALVLVNKGGATGQDIVRLSDDIRADVRRKFGVEIHPEVNFV